jgi:hypothetical protein
MSLGSMSELRRQSELITDIRLGGMSVGFSGSLEVHAIGSVHMLDRGVRVG